MLASKDHCFVHEHFLGLHFTRTLLSLDALLRRNCQYNSRTLSRFRHGAPLTLRQRRLTFIWIFADACASERACSSSGNSEKATKPSTPCTHLQRDVSGCDAPQGGVFLRVIVRLRTGYTTIGAMLPFLPEQRCPECGAVDSIEHLLLTCIALIERRSQLLSKITNLTLETMTVPLLLGFSSSLPTSTLRKITTETARFVVDCKRWP